jgi:DNA-binding PadR family transcriptional regulator
MNNAQLAILTLLAESPRHGYEIEQVIEARGMRNWTEIGFSSIYYILKRLEQEGMVRGNMQQGEGRGPARVVYCLTRQGRRAVNRGVLEALSVPEHSYPPIQIGLANLPGIPSEQARAALQTYVHNLRERRDQLLEKQESQQPLPPFVEAMFSYSTAMIDAELRWVEAYITQLEQEHDEGGF